MRHGGVESGDRKGVEEIELAGCTVLGFDSLEDTTRGEPNREAASAGWLL